jgi:UDP-GlcNAc:undecaprenyl-phosphate GlcNAc-1-phosphate transferase
MSDKVLNIAVIYAVFFICSVLFSVLINGLFLKFVKTLGIRNSADETIIRWGSQSKPAIGGISFYIIFLFSLAAYSFTISNEFIGQNYQFLGILMSSTVGFLIGLADDAYNTNPILKFLAQLLCALILIITGTSINLFDNNLINYFITVFWVIGLMNAINMLDNMDAITTVTSIPIVLAALIILGIDHNFTSINYIVLIGVLAALIGFLFFNWHPSRIYMGDTGSQFLGVFLGSIGIIYFWNAFPVSNGSHEISLKTILFPILIFILPIIDTTFVVINRLRKKKSPFIGGRDHTTHRLAYLGFSEQRIALVFFTISLSSSFLGVFLFKFALNNFLKLLILGIYFLVALISFIYISYLTIKNSKIF